MKKFISCILTAALIVTTVLMLEPCSSAYALTMVSDAKTAVEKNAAAFSDYIEKAEITNDITREDLENMIFECCEYTADKSYGTAYEVSGYRLIKATKSKEGSLKAAVVIFFEDAEEVVEVNKVIPKLTGDAALADADDDDISVAPSEDLGDDFDYKSEFQNAKTAINKAIWDFPVSNDTTKKDIIKMAEDALTDGSKIKVTIESGDFTVTKASTTVNGTLAATLTLICGTRTDRVSVGKTIEPVVTETSKKIEEDRSSVGQAIDKVQLSNRITKEEILNAGLATVKHGTQVSWESFSLKKATFDEKGEMLAYIKFALGEEERETRIQRTFPKLVRKVPTDKLSVNADEWDVLRLTNNARAAVGQRVLSMNDVLQKTTDIRETELLELYSHTRPNGTICFTALPSDYKYSDAGENITECVGKKSVPYSAADAVRGWINSPGHYANMIKSSFDYVGMGFLSVPEHVVGVQMFTNGSSIDTVETSAGTFSFCDTDDLQKEYLICTAYDGTVSYLPLDIEQMEKIDGGYKLNICRTEPVIFTITGESKTYDNSFSSFSDVSEDAYYSSAVKWAVQNNVTTGTSATTFSPDDTCTRAQILTFMWRALGSPEPTIKNPYNDVKESDYYYKPAVWAREKGILDSSEPKFNANTPCKRSDTMKYFWLYAGSPTATTAAFTDVSLKRDYFDAVNWAVASGITSGTSATTFSPDLICSRAQIVTFLLRAINILK